MVPVRPVRPEAADALPVLRGTVTWKLVRHNLPGRTSLPLHQFPEKTSCRLFVLSFLNQYIENISVPTAFASLMGQAFLIYGAPIVQSLTLDRHDVNIIHVPRITKCAAAFLDLSSISGAKFDTPTTNSFIRNNNSRSARRSSISRTFRQN